MKPWGGPARPGPGRDGGVLPTRRARPVVPTVCRHCGHEWEYGDDERAPPCPRCRMRTPASVDDPAEAGDLPVELRPSARKQYPGLARRVVAAIERAAETLWAR